MTRHYIPKTEAEIQSDQDRQEWAEGLILKLPTNHEGRNSWLLAYGRGDEAKRFRKEYSCRLQFGHIHWSEQHQATIYTPNSDCESVSNSMWAKTTSFAGYEADPLQFKTGKSTFNKFEDKPVSKEQQIVNLQFQLELYQKADKDKRGVWAQQDVEIERLNKKIAAMQKVLDVVGQELGRGKTPGEMDRINTAHNEYKKETTYPHEWFSMRISMRNGNYFGYKCSRCQKVLTVEDDILPIRGCPGHE